MAICDDCRKTLQLKKFKWRSKWFIRQVLLILFALAVLTILLFKWMDSFDDDGDDSYLSYKREGIDHVRPESFHG